MKLTQGGIVSQMLADVEIPRMFRAKQVFPREVIVLNKRFDPPKRERLKMDEATEESGQTPKGPSPAAMPPPPRHWRLLA